MLYRRKQNLAVGMQNIILREIMLYLRESWEHYVEKNEHYAEKNKWTKMLEYYIPGIILIAVSIVFTYTLPFYNYLKNNPNNPNEILKESSAIQDPIMALDQSCVKQDIMMDLMRLCPA